jgi:ribosome maturation factor RimP
MDSLELENKLRLLVEAAGFRLLHSHWLPRKSRPHLRIIADAEDHNITIDECAELSRAVADLLDSYPHDFPDYRLEVSSPGLNHPLVQWQYRKNLGRLVEVQYSEDGLARSLRGDFISVTDDEVCVKSQEQVLAIPLSALSQILVLPRI